MVGFAHNAVKQAFYSDDPSNLMLLRFETLTNEPARAIAAVYAFIGEPAYSHDFNNVPYAADEFDRRIGTPGLHTVRPKVEPVARASVLPPRRAEGEDRARGATGAGHGRGPCSAV